MLHQAQTSIKIHLQHIYFTVNVQQCKSELIIVPSSHHLLFAEGKARLSKSIFFSFTHVLFIHLLWISRSISSYFSEYLPLNTQGLFITAFSTAYFLFYHFLISPLFNFSFTFIHLLGPQFPSISAVNPILSPYFSCSYPLSALHSVFLLSPICTNVLSMWCLPSSFIYPGTALIGNSGLIVSTQVVFVTVSAERYG